MGESKFENGVVRHEYNAIVPGRAIDRSCCTTSRGTRYGMREYVATRETGACTGGGSGGVDGLIIKAKECFLYALETRQMERRREE